MINLSKSGDTIVFEFVNNGHYLQNGTIEVPVNSLSLVMDSSNMCTFYKADSNDVFVSATYDELGKTKAEMEAWYEENMVAPQGGGGGGVTSGQVQTMIDDSVSGYADSVLYNSTSKYVEFYHNGTGGTKVYEFDASDFVIDGMVDDVRIETISGVSYLVIDFNTASGKEDIQIPLTDIFNPDNYYTKTETDQALSGKQDTLSAGTNITITDNVISADVDAKGVEGGRGISVTTGETADTVAFNLPIYQGKGNSSLSLTQPSGTTQYDNKVSGYSTTAIGAGLNVNNQFETALGVHNVDSVDTSGNFGQSGVTLFSIGNGAGQNARHNAIEIKQNGDLYIADTNNTTYTNFYTKPMVKLQDVLDGKQDTLSAGTNITISGNVISAEGGGKAVTGGTNISVTTGETADTINCTLPLTVDSNNNKQKLALDSNYNFVNGTFNITANASYAIKNNIAFGDNNSLNLGNGNGPDGKCNVFVGDSNTFTNTVAYKPTLKYSFVQGNNNSISSSHSFIHGFGNNCGGANYQVIFGCRNGVNNEAEVALGKYNVSNTGSTDADRTYFSIGNGTATNARHNAFEIRRNGDIYITSGGTDVKLQDQLGGGGKAIEAGRGISVTTGETADTVSFNLPISADSNTYINAGVGNTNNNTALNILIGSGNTAYNGNGGTISGGTAIGFGNNVGYIGRGDFDKSYSFAFGYGNKIQGGHCCAIGEGNNIGSRTNNSKDKSFLIGYYNTCTFKGDSIGNYIFGNYCTVTKSDEFALGKYNASNTGSTDADKTFFSIGNGTADNARHNAFEIRQNGDIYITSGGTDIKLQDNLGSTIEISSAITSGDTNPVQGGAIYDKFDEVEQVTAAGLNALNDRVSEDEEVTAASLNALNDNFGGMKLVKLTEAEYNALATKDSSTLYIIVN